MAHHDGTEQAARVPVFELRGTPRRFAGTLDAEACAALAKRFDILSVERLSYDVQTAPWRSGVRLTGIITGHATQECVVTLDPVPEEIDERIDRGFLPMEALYSDDKPGSENEVVDDSELGDIPEPLTDPLDIGEAVAESFGLALDPYPRSEAPEERVFSAIPPGAEPITEADVKPFAGLAALRETMDDTKSGD